jgi:hypothetical protein
MMVRSMLRAPGHSMAFILGLAALAMADDARLPDKPVTDEERDHWAFRPARRMTPPQVREGRWVRNPGQDRRPGDIGNDSGSRGCLGNLGFASLCLPPSQ